MKSALAADFVVVRAFWMHNNLKKYEKSLLYWFNMIK